MYLVISVFDGQLKNVLCRTPGPGEYGLPGVSGGLEMTIWSGDRHKHSTARTGWTEMGEEPDSQGISGQHSVPS